MLTYRMSKTENLKFETWSPFKYGTNDSVVMPWMPWDLIQWSKSANAILDKQDLRDVLIHQTALVKNFNRESELITYGHVNYHGVSYPLQLVRFGNYDTTKPSIFVQGGTHGYEPSGVFANLAFQEDVQKYTDRFNVFAVACANPWAFVKDQRWGAHGVDGNRGWYFGSQNQEADALIKYMWQTYPEAMQHGFLAHISCHEAPPIRDAELEAIAAERSGTVFTGPTPIPDGFFLIADLTRNNPRIETAIIDAVEQATHIANADKKNKIYGCDLQQRGVIYTDVAGIEVLSTNPKYAFTTEANPESKRLLNSSEVINAQALAIHAALEAL